MVAKQITESDLHSLRNGIKSEVTAEQAQYRQGQSTIFQTAIIHLEDSMEEKMDKLIARFDSLEEKLEMRYAGKWTEKILIFV